MLKEKTEDDGKTEAEKERQRELREWLETRKPQDLLGMLQGLFLCAQQGTTVLTSMHVNAETGGREDYDLEVDDFHLIALEMHDRLVDAQEEVSELTYQVIELTERD
jgi:hypothetical protein